ncbi:mannose-6-phosphate isomerase, class I [Sphaerochaeta sp. PS]|uniref:mannose-6-phosphate isomerase, class I n=1 Tax=Sphaerochaeta sp. PS TaxID=3076336 RepID=UPI0028A427E7|nr:mannose-6-phosphate isomerase, class I [Sphaerochaeta sp. PS]MDT4761940.1 mannose-6-phosphate isomerase, class I [Sphaerochaeta sp. PS]
MNIVKIKAQVKEYDWGNMSFIPALLGQKEDGKPKAELWMGTHPSGDATVEATGESLSTFLTNDSLHWFGQEHLDRFGPELPLLLKVLAIDHPLSIQCHPTEVQAKEGWERETAFRTRFPKELWNYKDSNRKAEVIYALTPITAMCAFRPLAQILPQLRALMPIGYAKHFSGIDEHSSHPDKEISTLFELLYTMKQEELVLCIEEYIASLRDREDLPYATPDGLFLESKGIALSCYETFPKDPGLFAPFFLNVKHLQKGEALYLEPRTLHAYVLGNGIELMSASDNVLRGGLTHKKIDLHELMKIMEVKGKEVEPVLQLVGTSGRVHLLTPTEEFHLMVCPSGAYTIGDRKSIELLFCTEGKVSFSAGKERVEIGKGECHVVAASLETYKLEVEGTLFIADVPR